MAIYEENYVSYDGPLREGRTWWVIATNSLSQIIGFLRTKLIVLALWIPPILAIVASVAEYAFRARSGGPSGSPSPMATTLFLQMQIYSLALLFMASGCGVVSHDLRHQTFQLYFSKPLEKWEYGLGKFLSLVLLGSLVTVGPAIAVGAIRLALFSQMGFAAEVAGHVGAGLGLSLLATLLLSAIVVGLSSLTARTGYVVLAWIGVLLVPWIVGIIVGISTNNPHVAGLMSVQGNLSLVGNLTVAGQSLQVPAWAPFVLLTLIGGAGIGALSWRIKNLEGIA